MEECQTAFRTKVKQTLCKSLQPIPDVLAAWEGGSAAFGIEDEFSDIDLNFLLDSEADIDSFFLLVESTLESVSPVLVSHDEPPGRYFKLKDGGDYLLVDVCVYLPGSYVDCLNIERHGKIQPLFDKDHWLSSKPTSESSSDAFRSKRLESLKGWFSLSQLFVRKTINRSQEVEALAAFWGYTLKPLVELLRMRYCPERWDFGMRYLQRDLPGPVYQKLQDIMFVKDFFDLDVSHTKAVKWGEKLLREFPQKPVIECSPNTNECSSNHP